MKRREFLGATAGLIAVASVPALASEPDKPITYSTIHSDEIVDVYDFMECWSFSASENHQTGEWTLVSAQKPGCRAVVPYAEFSVFIEKWKHRCGFNPCFYIPSSAKKVTAHAIRT